MTIVDLNAELGEKLAQDLTSQGHKHVFTAGMYMAIELIMKQSSILESRRQQTWTAGLGFPIASGYRTEQEHRYRRGLCGTYVH